MSAALCSRGWMFAVCFASLHHVRYGFACIFDEAGGGQRELAVSCSVYLSALASGRIVFGQLTAVVYIHIGNSVLCMAYSAVAHTKIQETAASSETADCGFYRINFLFSGFSFARTNFIIY